MKRNCDRKAYAFFKKAAGYVVGERSMGALKLAKAECEMERRGWRVRWEFDQEPDLSWMDDEEREAVREVLCAILEDSGGNQLGPSLCGIVDPDRAYARVIEAELALEALGERK